MSRQEYYRLLGDIALVLGLLCLIYMMMGSDAHPQILEQFYETL